MDIMSFLLETIEKINTYLSDWIIVILLTGCGILYTLRTRFVQVRCFNEGIKIAFGGLFKKRNNESDASSFRALATAVAAQVGTGNIVGAGSAILIGGPGSILWMWITAFFGMATVYAEAVLAQKTRKVMPDGSVHGGPVYYIKKAFGGRAGKYISGLFAIGVVIALGFTGSMVQANAVGSTCSNAFDVPSWLIGLIVAALCFVVFIGGGERVAAVAEKLVPIMAGSFILCCSVVLIARAKYIPQSVAMIFKYAFAPDAILGGGAGYALKTAISQGVKRGLFSNEAGMGSIPHAHAMAKVKHPHDQGVVAMIGVFIDTFVILTMTALVMISVLYTGDGMLSGIEGGNASFSELARLSGVDEGNMMQLAMASVFGRRVGNGIVSVCIFFFAFSSIISWNYFGRINIEYLLGRGAVPYYYLLSVVFIFLGFCFESDIVWSISDLFNNLMIIPNVAALLILCGSVEKCGIVAN